MDVSAIANLDGYSRPARVSLFVSVTMAKKGDGRQTYPQKPPGRLVELKERNETVASLKGRKWCVTQNRQNIRTIKS